MSSTAQRSIRGGGGGLPRRRCQRRAAMVQPCFIFDRKILIGRISGTQGWTVNEIPSTPDGPIPALAGHGHPAASWEGGEPRQEKQRLLSATTRREHSHRPPPSSCMYPWRTARCSEVPRHATHAARPGSTATAAAPCLLASCSQNALMNACAQS